MGPFTTRPALRWLAPLAALGVVAGGALVATTATADKPLPPRTAEQLLVDVQQATMTDLWGTVVQTSDLGLPDLPGLTTGGGTSLTSLVSGTHTLRVWLSGEDKARLAVLGDLGEYDVIHNGDDVWTWSSDDKAATHYTLPDGADRPAKPGDDGTPMTPQEAAEKVLAALDPTTDVQTNPAGTVAGRDAYELVLTPRDDQTLISQVSIAVDGETKVPLRVQVFATSGAKVFESGFTAIDFTRPEDKYFDFTPAPGTDVTEVDPGDHTGKDTDGKDTDGKDSGEEADRPTVIGSGWSTVVVAKGDLSELASGSGSEDESSRGGSGFDLGSVLASLPAAPAPCPSGRILAGKAFTVVVTEDGRIAGGAVAPAAVCAALNR